MALSFENLLGAVTNITTAVANEQTYNSFLTNVSDYGIQVKNNFEVNFSGLNAITFRVQEITLPSIKANTTEIFYDGRSINVPINYDFEHDFSMTILNDAQGYIYPAIAEFIMSNSFGKLANNGYTMTLKALTGDNKYSGMLITCRGVRLTTLAGLDYGQNSNDVQTFSVQGLIQDYSVAPNGILANVTGTLNNLFG